MGALESKQVSDAIERAEAKHDRSKINRYIHANGKDESIIFDQIAGGSTIDQVAKQIGVSRIGLNKWLDTPERRLSLARARADAADALVELAMTLPDDADTAIDMKRAELKGKTLLWTAARWNRDVYGDAPQVQLNISTNEMHIDALRNRAHRVVDVPVTQPSTPVDSSVKPRKRRKPADGAA